MRARIATLRRVPVPLRILLVVALVEVLAWTVATAPFQGPDENNHFAYAQQLAETGSKPSFGTGSQSISQDEGAGLATLNLWQLIGNTQAKPSWSPLDVK